MMNARQGFDISDWRQIGFGMPKIDVFSIRMRRAGKRTCGADKAVLVGFQPEEQGRLTEELDNIGLRTVSVRLDECSLRNLSADSCSASLLFINFDAFDAIEDGVDQLMTLRAKNSNLVVVLCSASIRGDDLGNERSALCDVTLKLPLTKSRLRTGLRAALENREEKQFE